MRTAEDDDAWPGRHVNMSDQMKVGAISEYRHAVRVFSPSLWRLFLSSALVTTALFGIMAVLQNLFLLRLGFDARFIGLLLGSGQIVWAVAALPAGIVSNRIGLRNGIMLGQLIGALGLALMLLVESQPENVWRTWLMASQAVMMLGAAFFAVNIPPYLMALTGEQERRYAFAGFQAIIPATALLGSLIAGLLPGLFAGWLGVTLDQTAPYRLTLLAAPLLLFLATLPLLGADPASAKVWDQQQAGSGPAPIRWLFFFGVFVLLQVVGEGVARGFFNVYLDTALTVPTSQIGAVLGLAQILPIVAALSVPLLIARTGTGYAMATATLGIGLCLLPLAAEPGLGTAALAFVGVIATVTVANTTRDLFGQEMVTPHWRTTSQGVAIIGVALGWAMAGAVGGYLIETVSFGAVFSAAAVSAFASAGLLVVFLRRRRAPALPNSECSAA